MELFIKNMVCRRCILAVQEKLAALGIRYLGVQLGEVQLVEPLDAATFDALRSALLELGFELLDDKKSGIIAKIKSTIIEYVHGADDSLRTRKLSALLAGKLGLEYNYLSALFSSVEGITIEKYAILQRVERVKELISYGERNLNEIAFDLGYSSVQHLSQQFKKVTGMTASEFRALRVHAEKANHAEKAEYADPEVSGAEKNTNKKGTVQRRNLDEV
jgi:AraC family transcriptional regulator